MENNKENPKRNLRELYQYEMSMDIDRLIKDHKVNPHKYTQMRYLDPYQEMLEYCRHCEDIKDHNNQVLGRGL